MTTGNRSDLAGWGIFTISRIVFLGTAVRDEDMLIE